MVHNGSLTSARKKNIKKGIPRSTRDRIAILATRKASPRTGRPSPDTGYTVQSWAPEPNLHKETKYTKRKDAKQEAKGW